jgi:hypothetical protein
VRFGLPSDVCCRRSGPFPRKEDPVKGHVALVREQGVDFAVVVVKRHVVNSPSERDEAVSAFSIEFGVPSVLMAQDSRGVPTYYGRPDLVRFLQNILPEQLPWREFTMRAA